MTVFTGDQASRLRARVGRPRTRIITVTSGKGGVGKTTLVANLGLELARTGARVLLLDGDLGLANLSILFNVAPRRDLADVLAGRCDLDEVLLAVTDGLALIPASGGAAALADLADAPRQALVARLRALAAEADVLLVDTGAGIAATVMELVAMAERTLVVTTHEPTALSDAYALLKTAWQRGVRALDVVVNMAPTHAHARATHERLAALTARFLDFRPGLAAVIPRDPCVGEAVVRQEPLARVYPYAAATRAVTALARTLAPHLDTGKTR